MIAQRLIIRQLDAVDDEAVIRALSARLARAGCVREGFCEAVIERERVYPTGLASEIPIAIPHTVPEYCCRAGLAVALLDRPVTFREMAVRDRAVSVQIVFLPTITELGTNIAWLARLTDIIRETAFLRTMLSMSSVRSVVRMLRRRLWDMDEEKREDAFT